MSDSEDNPIDELILQPALKAAANRKAAELESEKPATGGYLETDSSASARSKRQKKSSSTTATPTPKQQGTDKAAQQVAAAVDTANGAHPAAARAAATVPVGVVVIDNNAPDPRNYEMQKLLRAPRYFDAIYEPKGVACWRCGKHGHLAKDCTLSAAKPCHFCAQYGHEAFVCPNRLCYRCGEPGHTVNDCPVPRSEGGLKTGCLRCGRSTCAAAQYGDWYRFENGCTKEYYSADLAMVRCLICGDKGHLCCQPAPLSAPKPSCWNCGKGHWAEECIAGYPGHLMAERNADRDRQSFERQQQPQHMPWRQQHQQLQRVYSQQQQQQQQQQQHAYRQPHGYGKHQQQGYQQGQHFQQQGYNQYQQQQQQQRWPDGLHANHNAYNQQGYGGWHSSRQQQQQDWQQGNNLYGLQRWQQPDDFPKRRR